MPKLTKRIIESTPPGSKDIILRDSEIKGFQCKITPKDKRVYSFYYRTAEGKERRPRIGTHGNITCEQAREVARQWAAIVAQGGDPSGDRQANKEMPTLEEIGKRYLEDKKTHLKPRSWQETHRLWQRDIIPALGKIKINQLTISDIQLFHRKNADRPYVANRLLVAISSSINHAMSQKWINIPENPCKAVKKYPEKSRERFLNSEEIQRLFAHLDDADAKRTEMPSVTNLIRLLLLTGCRLTEILTLQWSFIDWEKQCLHLPDSKTGAKTVYIAPAVLEIFRSITKAENTPYVLIGKKEGTHLVSPQKSWERIRKQTNLEDVRLHDLRHSFASIGAAKGLSLPMIGALMGHRTTQTTAKYAHLMGDPLREAAALIGEDIHNSVNA